MAASLTLTSQNAQACYDVPEVLIVGGGLAGLSMAKALEKINLKPDLIEKRTSFNIEGAGIAIPANGSWALEKLGIDIKATARHITHMIFTDDHGHLLVQEDIQTIHPEHSQFYTIDRSSLHHLLKNALTSTTIQMNTTIKSLKEEAHKISVEFSTGQTKSYDYVIAADGAHSETRSFFYPQRMEDLGLHVWRTLIPTPQKLEHPTYMLGSDKAALFYPLNSNQTYLYGHRVESIHALDHRETALNDLMDTLKEFSGLMPDALKTLERLRPTIYSHYLESTADITWNYGERIIFIGDAAHTFSPMLQNGGAQAFEDAYVLGSLFEKYLNDKANFSIVSEFKMRRDERVRWVQSASNQRIKALSSEDVLKRNAFIKEKGAPNVAGFKVLMKNNP